MTVSFEMISDIIIVVFNLLIYTGLTPLKKDRPATRLLMYGGCGVILAAYIVSAYIFHIPAAMASFLCMSLPSFALLWILAKYKDSRFIVTFCLVDTVTLMMAFLSRIISVLIGWKSTVFSCVLSFLPLLTIYLFIRPYFAHYRRLLESVRDGWITMMLSTLLIYVLLIFSAAYPAPIMQRTEYIPVYLLMVVTILSFYIVFIMQLVHKQRLHDLNMQLQHEKEWHRIAYFDGLTNMKNRMAYMERVNELERCVGDGRDIHAIIIDLDDFKQINDTFGHHAGDAVLRNVAAMLGKLFSGNCYELFRIGGDEFAVIAIGVGADEIARKVDALNLLKSGDQLGCCISCGHAVAQPNQNNALENAFICADRAMYHAKNAKKPET